MKFRFTGTETDRELLRIFKAAAVGDLLIFLLTLPIYGFSSRVVLGLLLGTAAMSANILLLAYSVVHSVDRGSEKRGKRYLFSFYLLRFSIMGAALAAGFIFPCFDSVCTFIPLLFPKTLYTLMGVKDHLAFKKSEWDKKHNK